MRRDKSRTLTLAVAVLMIVSTAQAATITQTVNNQSRLNAVWGPGPNPPTAGNDYVMVTGVILRTSPAGFTADGTAGFPGNSINMPKSMPFSH